MAEKRATFTLLYIEIMMVSLCANDLKKRSRYLKGDKYEFIYTYQTLVYSGACSRPTSSLSAPRSPPKRRAALPTTPPLTSLAMIA